MSAWYKMHAASAETFVVISNFGYHVCVANFTSAVAEPFNKNGGKILYIYFL
jgi:hypothetical protein